MLLAAFFSPTAALLTPLRKATVARIQRANDRIADINKEIAASMVCDDEICLVVDDALDIEDSARMPPRLRKLVNQAKLFGSQSLLAVLPEEAQEEESQVAALERRLRQAEAALEARSEVAPTLATGRVVPAACLHPADHLPVAIGFKGRTAHATISADAKTDRLIDIAQFVHVRGPL